LEDIHQQIKSVCGQQMAQDAEQLISRNLLVLDNFFKYLLLQTFPEVLSIQNVDDYAEILDTSSFEEFQ